MNSLIFYLLPISIIVFILLYKVNYLYRFRKGIELLYWGENTYRSGSFGGTIQLLKVWFTIFYILFWISYPVYLFEFNLFLLSIFMIIVPVIGRKFIEVVGPKN